MENEVLEEGQKTEEGRLKIKQIRKLTAKNSILNLIRIAGILTSMYIDGVCILTILGPLLGIESSNSILTILLALFFTHRHKKSFTQEIPMERQENFATIERLKYEILNNKVASR